MWDTHFSTSAAEQSLVKHCRTFCHLIPTYVLQCNTHSLGMFAFRKMFKRTVDNRHMFSMYNSSVYIPLTLTVVGAPQMTSRKCVCSLLLPSTSLTDSTTCSSTQSLMSALMLSSHLCFYLPLLRVPFCCPLQNCLSLLKMTELSDFAYFHYNKEIAMFPNCTMNPV